RTKESMMKEIGNTFTCRVIVHAVNEIDADLKIRRGEVHIMSVRDLHDEINKLRVFAETARNDGYEDVADRLESLAEDYEEEVVNVTQEAEPKEETRDQRAIA